MKEQTNKYTYAYIQCTHKPNDRCVTLLDSLPIHLHVVVVVVVVIVIVVAVATMLQHLWLVFQNQ